MTSKKTLKLLSKQQGFTLIELVSVIVLLGIMAVGFTSFIGLTTQSYVNATVRDELIASARFSVERINRELRHAVPNSMRVTEAFDGSIKCLEFIPIKASTSYVDIPVAPETAESEFPVIPFINQQGNDYLCSNCGDFVTVYPSSTAAVYTNLSSSVSSGRSFPITDIADDATTSDQWTVTLANGSGVLFEEESPTRRLYVFDSPVSFCMSDAQGLVRYSNYPISVNQPLPPNNANQSLMAQNFEPLITYRPFEVIQPTQQRNALVQIELRFSQNNEQIVFENEVHVMNTP
ncbi:PilW family protein [Thalassotalea agarivorans]|uniref:MSHA biogenesis protein MshO n=1 Tax=Thalassotalea agarivorans TaxID=349064 RepID=A0A1I0FYZ6_THASX|nr:type II secretion system protein [Thalassotalea agarivorans]SET63793.1 MSHA biogenesis protein MshO [Thalassotalea agarivorans]